MSRWSYLPPRLIILGLILLALWASADPISQMLVVSSIENRTGGKVEVAQLRCSIGNQKLYLKDLVLSDPEHANRNLLQADMAYLDFDANALWRGQLVVTDGQTSRLMFGTPRSSGQPEPLAPSNEADATSNWVTSSTEELGQAWLDNLALPNNKLNKIAESQTAQANKRIVAFWDQQLQQMAKTVVDIKQLTTELNQLAAEDQSTDNPLRRKWQGASNSRLQEMETQNKNVALRVESLREQLRKDVAAIEQAQAADAQEISGSITALELDGNQLSDLLLEDLHAGFVNQSIEMFQWFREVRPEISCDFAPKSQRGIDIPIEGSLERPACWVKKIEINGEGRLLGQHFDFSGHAYNLATEPELLDEPATFEIHAQGKKHAAIICKLDRTQAEPIDSVKITCPDLSLGERTLGHKNSMQLTLGASNKVFAEVDLKSVGEQVSGTIKLRYSNVALHVDSLNDFAGGRVAALQMNEGVTAIDNFESVIAISGDQNKIVFKSQSNLGQRFATAMNSTLKQRTGNAVQQQLDELVALKKQIVDQLQSQVENQLERLQAAISSNQTRIANLEAVTKSSVGDQLRGLRRFK